MLFVCDISYSSPSLFAVLLMLHVADTNLVCVMSTKDPAGSVF
jgi:hypothetical protein